ncbi:MAG: ATP-binding cassette domain-containing protein [Brevinemataceae bacterium]
MIQISNLNKSYAHQDILKDISFTIHKGEKTGLVGRNGHGKTTLFRILAGLESPDSGTILFPKNYKVGYLKQEIDFSSATVLEEVVSALPQDEMYEVWKAEKILSGLDFSKEMMLQSPDSLSGGWMNRINLAKLLAGNADMLLLDEPTNHLDIITIRWLIGFLKSWRKELILITHDRFFMDAIVDHTMAIHRKKLKKIKGGSEKIYEQIAQEEEIYEKTRLNDEKEREHVETFIRKFRAKARLAGMVQSRIKAIEKKENKHALEQIKNIDFEFNFKSFESKNMISCQNLIFGYNPEELLIKDLSVSISKGDRVAIIGKNGKGKSTLLKILSKKLTPISGLINIHPQLLLGYYGQIAEQELDSRKTVEEEILSALPPGNNQTSARSIAGAMLFEGPLALKKCGVLSGGEKARVLLGKLIAAPSQCLFLDEPSNHLDMQSVDSLIEALDQYPGSMVFITHNEMILHALANRLIVFDGDFPYVFEGTYQEFLEDKGFSDDNIQIASNSSNKVSKKEDRKAKAKIQQQINEKIKPIKQKILSLEQEITKTESQIITIQEELVKAASEKESSKIETLSKELFDLKAGLEVQYQTLFETSELLEHISKESGI